LEQLRGCTGVAGRERYVNWLGPATPDPPAMRAWAQNNRVHVFWSDVSERSLDPVSGMVDFEGYQVWRADGWDRPLGTSTLMGPPTDQWQLIAAYDVENMFLRTRGGRRYAVVDTLPLGDNTGLEEIRYVPACLEDPVFYGLGEAMRGVVEGLERLPKHLPALRDRDGAPTPGLEALLPWEAYVAVLDTFYMTTGRDAEADSPEKVALNFYEYIDDVVHNGFLYFYSLSVSDHLVNEMWDPQYTLGEGLDGDPAVNFTTAQPTTAAQSAADRDGHGERIFVYPNPATRRALDDFQRLHPNGDDPTGVRVMFANLPEARSVIRIYSLNGDLVAEVDHDGYGGRGEASWNLVSRNGQQVVSGVYLYCVQTEGSNFSDVIGKFVVIR